ncbi:MAG: ATP-binding protein [Promethearchaeota archaeon]
MPMYKVVVNHYLCDGCGDCYSACPINASLKKKNMLNDNTAIILIKNGKANPGADGCDGCGVCVRICHKQAIKIEIVE